MNQKIRLDILVAKKFELSRVIAKQKIIDGQVFVNNKQINKPNFLVDAKTTIELHETKKEIKQPETLLKPWKKAIEIVYEDEYIFVVNKPNNLIVHPTKYENQKTLANIIANLFIEKKIPFFGDPLRNGIVHRLDKDTQGLIIVAKSQAAFDAFVSLFINKKITKKYLALVYGFLKTKTVKVDAPLKRNNDTILQEVSTDFDAKDAISIFKEMQRFKNFSLVEVEIETGRTHQIRAHAQFINNHIINDLLYGDKNEVKIKGLGQYLVSYSLEFIHPFLKKEININLGMPKSFKEYINKYGK
ncbi:MAG: RluA family pseudouridine synthase [Malacoplasma sp.]|nr:RluA family pseudouridine synthase [Malacoplasma sp.]